ncbi:MAG: AlwI family type II restriction endonuclease [Bacteroidales bacterium]|nr:AlwI family type II restriction endonuclease [Bacteroidales bacterium]
MAYADLYKKLHLVFFEKQTNNIAGLLRAIKKVNIGKWWRQYLFDTSNERAIRNNSEEHINANVFQNCTNEEDFKKAFFKILHLFKAKAILSDYFDLNRRYIKTTDIILFEDGQVKLDVVPKQFFSSAINQLYQDAFIHCSLLHTNCDLVDISSSLVYNEQQIISNLNSDLGESISTIEEAYSIVDKKRYERFGKLIESKFTDENLLTLLDKFNSRDDDFINSMVTDNADIPTIFEYVLGIIWYKVSNQQGKILDYLKLSLDADLLPVTHAAGGEADIVYEYSETDSYPEHTLLLEATLADSTNQRRMEMEPVSRHLGNHLLATRNLKSYCVFATNNLNINVISDFRNRKTSFYYNTQNPDDYIEGMKKFHWKFLI